MRWKNLSHAEIAEVLNNERTQRCEQILLLNTSESAESMARNYCEVRGAIRAIDSIITELDNINNLRSDDNE